MRQVSGEFAARLAASGTSLCTCWRFTRRDGATFGATDHDRAIAFDSVIYEPASGLRGATFESSAGLAPGRATAEGAISAEFITEADLHAGLWDGARVDVWRVDWEASEHRVRIWSGWLSEATRQGVRFTAELVSLKADLERPVGRVYARACDADVGDMRCGVDLDDPAFRGEGLVVEALGPKRVRVSGLASFDGGWFAGGALAWTGGANVATTARVIRHIGNELELVAAPRFAGQQGSEPAVSAGAAIDSRIVFLTGAEMRLNVADWERGLDLEWRAWRESSDGPAVWNAIQSHDGLAGRMWSPAHLKAEWSDTDLAVSWIRRARRGGDSWGPGEPPHEAAEAYRIRILEGGDIRRAHDVSESSFAYLAADQVVDFPDGGSARIEVAQLGLDGEPGAWARIDVEIPA